MNKITTLALAAGSLALAACGGSSYSSSNTTSKSSSSTSASSGGGGYGSSSSKNKSTSGSSSAPGKSVEEEMYDNYFGTKTISGKPGSTVTVKLKNEGKAEHNFKIDSQKKADADVEPGKSATISVKIPSSGSVQFYCEYHKGLGMVGTVKAA